MISCANFNIYKMATNCGPHGIGPCCRATFAKEGFYDVLMKRIDVGEAGYRSVNSF